MNGDHTAALRLMVDLRHQSFGLRQGKVPQHETRQLGLRSASVEFAHHCRQRKPSDPIP